MTPASIPPAAPLTDLSRIAIHTMTNRPLGLAECIRAYQHAGIRGMSVWRNVLDGLPLAEAGRMVRDSGLKVPALVRGGFFVAPGVPERVRALDDNRLAIEQAHAIGAEMVVLVCGAVPGISLPDARRQIADGLGQVLPEAAAAGVKLAIEPLHPMYAANRSAVNTMKQANDLCEALAHPAVGVAADVFHIWWDDDLQTQLARCGAGGWLLALHICDWKAEMDDMLNDRGLMGEGCINIRQIRAWAQAAGFLGMLEVEIFSQRYWAMDQTAYIERIKQACLQHA